MDKKPKPCPFCGDNPAIRMEQFYADGRNVLTLYYVECVNYNCPQIEQETVYCETMEDAVKAWNGAC